MTLIFNGLCKFLVIRVFASKQESARKYSLIFRGRAGNSEGKIKIRLRFESCPYCSYSDIRDNTLIKYLNRSFYGNKSPLSFYRFVLWRAKYDMGFYMYSYRFLSQLLYIHKKTNRDSLLGCCHGLDASRCACICL